MELLPFETCYSGRRVAVTGHTGFTGGWLCSWLNALGADVSGLSLDPPTDPNLFTALSLADKVDSHIGDIRDPGTVERYLAETKPEIVFHLAAQPIVSAGYDDPRGTFDTNVMGTLNVLEAARHQAETKAAVCITTDKVYRNNEWEWGYREVDPLGGTDPYSASKSACEMVVHTYQHALAPRGNGMLIAAARGGNIIGGGDWADNRIVPDFVRASIAGESLVLRNPDATRPWQHVLALVHGYMMVGSRLMDGDAEIADAWNFGPSGEGEKTVGTLVAALRESWPGVDLDFKTPDFKESHFLHLSSEKAHKRLGWEPGLDFDGTVRWTADWYREFHSGSDAVALTDGQIEAYRARIGQTA
ncbi:MAG: CDP-glucose 4,6-dehydratase [Rhodobiaceae bacterium]|nr:CDP-glucose 4,6-dehydratase [Rhodobiaceae bacterium]